MLRRFLPARFASELTFAVRNTAAAFRASDDWDVVLSSTPPLALGAGAAIIAAVRHIPLVWWVQDLHPEIAVALGLTSSTSLSFRILHALHAWILGRARLVIAISDSQRQRLFEVYPSVDKNKVVVLQNPAAHVALAAFTTRAAPLLLSYTGNLGLSQGLEHLLDVALAARQLPVYFRIHGRGAAAKQLRGRADRLGLTNLEFTEFVNDEAYLKLLQQSDVLLLSLLPGIDHYSFPSKLWTYLAAGRPVLAFVGIGGAVEQTLTDSGAGSVVAWGDVDASVSAISELLDVRRRQTMASAASRYYLHHASPDQHAARVLHLLQSALLTTAPDASGVRNS